MFYLVNSSCFYKFKKLKTIKLTTNIKAFNKDFLKPLIKDLISNKLQKAKFK